MTKVIVVWAVSSEEAEKGNFTVLTYGDGEPRVYEKDRLDWRVSAGLSVPFFSSIDEAKKHLSRFPGPANGVQLSLAAAKAGGLL